MYKLHNTTYMGVTTQSVIRTDGLNCYTSIPFDPDNTDYQQYLKWVAEGNTPEPADEQGAE
jgi:hypothetical protein